MPIDPILYYSEYAYFERYENTLALKKKFPKAMIIPYLTILIAAGAVIGGPVGAIFGLAPAAAAGLAVGGFTHLSVIFYGIVNDQLATQDSLEYFRFGHQPGQRESVCIPSTNKNAQAFHWGVLATWLLSLLGSLAVGLAAGFAAVPLNSLVIPLIATLVLTSLCFTHGTSGIIKSLLTQDFLLNMQLGDEAVVPSLNLDAKANWLRCGIRNSLGYLTLPLIGVGLTIGIAIGSGAGILAALPIAVPVLPLAIGIPMMLYIGGMFVNFLRHRNTIDPEQTLIEKFIRPRYPDWGTDSSPEPTASLSYWPAPKLPGSQPAAVTLLRDAQIARAQGSVGPSTENATSVPEKEGDRPRTSSGYAPN